MSVRVFWTRRTPDVVQPTGEMIDRFPPREMAEGLRATSTERRAEWRCGRLLARAALEAFQQADCGSEEGPPSSTGLTSNARADGLPSAATRLEWSEVQSRWAALDPWEILSRDGAGKGTAPRAFRNGRRFAGTLSISHDGPLAAALVASEEACGGMPHCEGGGGGWGVDVVRAVRFARGFIEMWFTAPEEAAWRTGPPEQAALGWSVKEAGYKALQQGEVFAPGRIRLLGPPGGCGVAAYDAPGGAERLFRWASVEVEDFRLTVAAAVHNEDIQEAIHRTEILGRKT